MQENWFKTWFNSPYYHILYKERDNKEASLFANSLVEKFKLSEGSKILDLGCGKGRLSKEFIDKKFEVVGLDISEENINFCNTNLSNNISSFFQHDMRQPFRSCYFDWVVNFFSSFGYFKNENDNLRTVKQAYIGLKKDGFFVLDFMNVDKVIPNLIAKESKNIQGIEFKIERFVENGFIKKNITVIDNNINESYQESVMALREENFNNYFKKVGFKNLELFGDYHFNKFEPKNSDRLIMVVRK